MALDFRGSSPLSVGSTDFRPEVKRKQWQKGQAKESSSAHSRQETESTRELSEDKVHLQRHSH